MSGKGKFLIIMFIAVALLSAIGLYRLFELRFESGDMFPPYSSLRSDPLGCKALFLACGRTPGMKAMRSFRDPGKLQGPPGRTIFYMGADEALFETAADQQADELEKLANAGNRLVIALVTAKNRPAAEEESAGGENEPAAEEDDQQSAGDDDSAESKTGKWGIEVGYFEPPTRLQGKERIKAALTEPAALLPSVIPLHSRRWLQPDKEGWRPVYSYDEQAVVLERTVGKGSIVLMADSYLLSNEAMRNDRFPGLLSWLLGANRSVLFDEFHLGVYDNPGVMTLIRKHGLIQLLLALLALAALYVWKSAIPFVRTPVPEKVVREEGVRDNFSGLVHLLRRNIAPGELLNACFREWSSSFAREFRQIPALEEQIKAMVADEAALPAGKRDPLKRYREIARVLANQRGMTKKMK